MLRPGWFPEYTPFQQRIFDKVLGILTQHFTQRNYQHIHTPAVESIDILKKWGDIIDKQVYGLYGLAQWSTDTKDYGLHFDLTIPLARYVLDHKNDLIFPFKRYQIQPVWRGERTKRGRFKEFWQCDIDTIRPTPATAWLQKDTLWYDTESIIVMYRAIAEIFSYFGLPYSLQVKVSNIGLTSSYLQSLGGSSDQCTQTMKLLDDYYKIGHEKISSMLQEIRGNQSDTLIWLLWSHDHTAMSEQAGYDDLTTVLTSLQQFKIPAVYDISIIRGHGYYTGTVVEFFVAEDITLGAVAWGGRYERITDFIDPKQSYSGVGCSVSNRMMELIFDHTTDALPADMESSSYLTISFEETRRECEYLTYQWIQMWKVIECYPTSHKLKKQFEYADRKGIRYALIYGPGEQAQWIIQIKDLKTSQTIIYRKETSAGMIVFSESSSWLKVLLVHTGNYRWFPKGHTEWSETYRETAIREVQEEVGVKPTILIDTPLSQSFIMDKYPIFKTIYCFVASGDENEPLIPQASEVDGCGRYTIAEAREKFEYPDSDRLLTQALQLFRTHARS